MKKAVYLLAIIGFIVVTPLFFCSVKITKPYDEIALGKQLFFDSILSSNYKLSCASCHKPEFAFADNIAISLGVDGKKGVRNTPSAMNVTNASFFFWDGRAATLEEQALMPISNPVEMNLPIDSALHRLRQSKFYSEVFNKIFGEEPSAKNLGKALAAFQKSMETSDSPFDDWKVNENENAISASAKRGFELFNGKANCVRCHFGSDFSNNELRNIGLYDGKNLNDSGRSAITNLTADIGKFKIGPLRNIALTAPYMHNGMFKTLREVIEYYNEPDKVVPNSINRDSLLAKPLHLSEKEKNDMENFLLSLTSKSLVAKK